MTTIQEAIDRRERIYAHCEGGNDCYHSQELDLVVLARKLGPEHGAMHADLTPLLRCKKCRSKKVGITVHPDTGPQGDLRSPYAKAKGQ